LRNKLKKKYLRSIIIILIISVPLLSKEVHYKWQRIAGIWDVKNSLAFETQGKAVTWNYYEILNVNTILTVNPFNNYSCIDLQVNITDRVETPSEFMISFAVTSEHKYWFYHMYAFKLTGGFWGINKASFIYSDRLDKSKPFNTKHNIFIKELASANCKVKYDKMYNYRVSFEGNNVVLYINDEKILSAPFPEKSHDGRIAISSKNVKIAVDKVTVKKGNETVFEDDFNEDSIYVRVLKAKRVKDANPEKAQEKK